MPLALKGYSGAPVLVRDRQQEAAAGLIRWNPVRFGELAAVGGMVFACPVRSIVESPGLQPFRAQLNLVAHSGAAASGTADVVSDIRNAARGAEETGESSNRMFTSAKALSAESLRLKAEVDKFLDGMRAA